MLIGLEVDTILRQEMQYFCSPSVEGQFDFQEFLFYFSYFGLSFLSIQIHFTILSGKGFRTVFKSI